jgi:hypothetical protein
MSGSCSTYGRKDMYTEFLLERCRRRYEDNIKTDLKGSVRNRSKSSG